MASYPSIEFPNNIVPDVFNKNSFVSKALQSDNILTSSLNVLGAATLNTLQSNDKMTLLNLINQEHNKTKHIILEKDKFKSVLNQINKQSKLRKSIELYESSELLHESSESYESSELLHESNESYESSELQESNSEFDNIYANKEKEEIVYYDNQPKLKTVAKIMYSKHNLDQLIKKKKW